MIKKRSRPQTATSIRALSVEAPEEQQEETVADEEAGLPLADLLELRKLRKAREGIDVSKLNKGDTKKKKKRAREEDVGGLVKPGANHDDEEEEGKEKRTLSVLAKTNFTQQTNALDVDKHMMAYIEENLKVRSKPRDEDEEKKPLDPQEALYNIADRWKIDKQKLTTDVGNVTNSLTMLTAIPEVDLGMDTRLKNIEETEKAKRLLAEEQKERKKQDKNQDPLVGSRFYRPNMKPKSDADILRDAKLEAMGLSAQDYSPPRSNNTHTQMATDEIVMERFKKRMKR